MPILCCSPVRYLFAVICCLPVQRLLIKYEHSGKDLVLMMAFGTNSGCIFLFLKHINSLSFYILSTKREDYYVRICAVKFVCLLDGSDMSHKMFIEDLAIRLLDKVRKGLLPALHRLCSPQAEAWHLP